MLWLHQGVRPERRSLTAWCVKMTRCKPPQGSVSQAPDYNVPLGYSQHDNLFSSNFPLVLGEICIPSTAAVWLNVEEESGCEIHEGSLGSGLSKDEGSKGDHEHPIAYLGPPAVDTGQALFTRDLHPNIQEGIGESRSTFCLPDCPGFLDLRELGLNQAEP